MDKQFDFIKKELIKHFQFKDVAYKNEINENIFFEAIANDNRIVQLRLVKTGFVYYKNGSQWIQIKGFKFD
ncbi:hypothetical protein [Clostridium sp. C8-1-8]|uniref:hypothetical protein n=1 Tax=Clostridium sp. C8-1-8 TaxID=2698831 RepID=UPI00136E0E46|nr:hypothetical protein [Clostridium sp. C8-1-8]